MPALDDILAIPGNRPIYQRLRDLLETRQAIAFAGAGVSAPLYPLWPGLLKSLAQAPVDQGLATPADMEYWLRIADKRPLQVASQIHQKLTDAHYYPFLYETFKHRPPYFTPAHDALIRHWVPKPDHHQLRPGTRRSPPRPPPGDPRNQLRHLEPARGNRTVAERGSLRPRLGPILFATAHFADALNIVLTMASYRRAYATPAFRRWRGP
jgi:hypothetical protein